MRTPERLNTLKNARKTLRLQDQKIIAILKKKLDSLTSQVGVAVDDERDEGVISNQKSF